MEDNSVLWRASPVSKDGGFLGTIGTDGSGGCFRLRPCEVPSEMAGDPVWLGGQWARLHPDWDPVGILRFRSSPEMGDNIVYELNFQDFGVPRDTLRFRVCGAVYGEDDAFWRLAPGEGKRFGGPDLEIFIASWLKRRELRGLSSRGMLR